MKQNSLFCGFKLTRICAISVLIGTCSCASDFLDAKPNKAILVPTTLEQYQALLDNAMNIMNITPYLGEVSADDFYIRENTISSFQPDDQNAYVWAERIYTNTLVSDWDLPYKQVFYSNVVLDGLEEFSAHSEEVKRIKGIALFHRGWALFQIAQIFAAPFDPKNASSTKGIPIRLSSDVTRKVEVGTLEEAYRQIISDVTQSVGLLPSAQTVPTRPTKAAAYALLARLNLVLKDYNQAKLYADSTLAWHNELLDYNTVDGTKAQPFPDLYLNASKNTEVIFLTSLIPNLYLGTNNNTLIDTTLYASYSDNDLRKTLYFNKENQFRGSYMGQRAFVFSGLAIDEIVIIRAEANARIGNINAALSDLNYLLINRHKRDNYTPINTTNSLELLQIILEERRKELVGRGIRWGDLKRLNQESSFKKVLQRRINNAEYTLLPTDKRYALPFPDTELK
jgi:hypothetical protein